MIQSLAPIITIKEVTPGVYLTWLECPPIAAAARPGQFVMVGCGEGTLLRRPLSIHQVDGNKARLALLFATVGRGTQWLSQRKTGDLVDLLGPCGNSFVARSGVRNLLMLGGGVGVAPLVFWADAATREGYRVRLFEGAGTVGELCSAALPLRHVKCEATTLDGSAGRQGLVTDIIPGLASWADQVFACGPAAMYRTMAQMPELRGKPVQVSLEARMACGFGVCYGCTIKTRRGLRQVCSDGPVFELDDLLPDELDPQGR